MNKTFSKDLIIREWIWGDDYSKLDFTEKDGTDPLGWWRGPRHRETDRNLMLVSKESKRQPAKKAAIIVRF